MKKGITERLARIERELNDAAGPVRMVFVPAPQPPPNLTDEQRQAWQRREAARRRKLGIRVFTMHIPRPLAATTDTTLEEQE